VDEILLFNKFFQLSICALIVKIEPDKVVQWCTDGDFLCPVFSVSHVQYVSDHHHTTTVLQPFFSGTTRVSWCQKITFGFMMQGEINRGRHTDHPAGRHSI